VLGDCKWPFQSAPLGDAGAEAPGAAEVPGAV
jgi:hypothetical protein